jgi:hypothetical protein
MSGSFKTQFKAPSNNASLVGFVFDGLVSAGNISQSSPFSFPIVVVAAIGGSYLLRYLRDDIPLNLLTLATVLLWIYYTLVEVYQLFIYNRHLNPLLAIPGPRVSPLLPLISGTLASRSIPNPPRITSTLHQTKLTAGGSPPTNMDKRMRQFLRVDSLSISRPLGNSPIRTICTIHLPQLTKLHSTSRLCEFR